MQEFWHYYQYFPYKINPTAFTIGPFFVSWYSLTYLAGFFTVYFLLQYRLRKKEFLKNKQGENLGGNIIFDLLVYLFLGLLIGARLGYVIIYNSAYYWEHPLSIISPFDELTGQLVGIYGMSYHGGLIGIILVGFFLSRKYQLNFRDFSEWIIPAVPAGYFWGRLGNFLNSELFGRVTEKPWGMFFPTDYQLVLRHPSQLYEALAEGGLLFLLLWCWRRHPFFQGRLTILYLIGYSIIRFFLEFFRQPDEQIGLILGFLTAGQILSLILIILAIVLDLIWKKRNFLLQLK